MTTVFIKKGEFNGFDELINVDMTLFNFKQTQLPIIYIEEELMSLNYSIGRVEKGLELVRDENEIGCEAMILKHVHNDSYEAIALELSCSRRHVITKIKEAEELLEKIMK